MKLILRFILTNNESHESFVDARLNILRKKSKIRLSVVMGLEMTLTNNDIKDIINVIRSLGNRGVLLIETTRKVISQERRLFNFLVPLMKAGLPLMKNVFTPLA